MAKLKLSDVKFGGIYKIKTDQYAAHGYAKGDQVEVVYLQGNTIQIKGANGSHGQNINVYVSHLDFYAQTKTQIEQTIAEAKETIASGEAKLKWMVDTKNEEFDEDEYKVWRTLQIIEDPNSNKVDKAKAIAALIKK